MTENAQQQSTDHDAAASSATRRTHLVGLLLGAEEDWPTRLRGAARARRSDHDGRWSDPRADERAAHHRAVRPSHPVRTGLVIDRLAYWYYHPREWLKKAALVNGTYLLNSPFTFQSMEKHSAYCALLRLGLKVPRRSWCPTRTPSTTSAGPTPRQEVQPAVRPRQDRRRPRLPDVHEAVRRWRLARRLADQQQRRPPPGLRRVRRDAHAPPGHRRVRALRTGAVDRPRDDGDELPAPTSRCTTGTPSRTASCPSRPATRPSRSRGSSTRSSAGSSTPARCSSRATTSTRSTTPTPAPTSRSPRCTTTSRGRSRRSCAGRPTASRPGAAARGPRDAALLRRSPTATTWTTSEARRLPRPRRRALRDRRLLGVVRREPPAPRRGRPRVGAVRRLPADPALDRAGDLPRARAGPVHGPLLGLVGLWVNDEKTRLGV